MNTKLKLNTKLNNLWDNVCLLALGLGLMMLGTSDLVGDDAETL